MKQGIHPEYREVVFWDVAADFKFLTRSTVPSSETVEYEGREYPMIKIPISSASHPFYTGNDQNVFTQGRVERFRQKFKGDYFANKGKKAKK